MSKLVRDLRESFNEFSKMPKVAPAVMGDIFGNVAVPNRTNYVYVRIFGTKLAQVYNVRVSPLFDLPVLVGYDDNEPERYQVLCVRNGIPNTNTLSHAKEAEAHHASHEFGNIANGSDVVFSQLRQLMPLRPTPFGDMRVNVYRNVSWIGNDWRVVSGTTIDYTDAIPVTGAYFLQMYLTPEGGISHVTGTLKDLNTLLITDIPDPVKQTIPIAAIRLYAGQTGIVETRTSTDLVDLRWNSFATNSIIQTDATYYLHEEDADIAPYEQLLTTPSHATGTSDSVQVNLSSGTMLIDSYLSYPTSGLGTTIINGGAWEFATHAKVDSLVGTTTLLIKVYKRDSGGTETLLFTVTTPPLTTSNIPSLISETIQSDFFINSTDRLLVKYYAQTTSVPLRTVTLYYEGTTTYSHIHTPIQTASSASTGTTGGGHTIQDDGTPLTQRTNLDFVGGQFVLYDNAGGDQTIVSGVPVAGADDTSTQKVEVKQNHVLIGTRKGLNFRGSTGVGVLVSDDAGNNDVDIALYLTGTTGGVGGGHTIAKNGTPLAQRTTLDFIGNAFSLWDDAGNDKTIVSGTYFYGISTGSVVYGIERIRVRQDLYSQSLATSGTFIITGISQAYDDLEILLVAKSSKADTDNCNLGYVYFNGDFASNKYYSNAHMINANNVHSLTRSIAPVFAQSVPSSNTSSVAPYNWGIANMRINKYTGAQAKMMDVTMVETNCYIGREDTQVYWYTGTSAITQLDFRVTTGTAIAFASGSSIRLVGIKNIDVVIWVSGTTPSVRDAGISTIVGDGINPISTGTYFSPLEIPYNMTVEEVSIFADVTGSVEFDILKCPYSGLPPTGTIISNVNNRIKLTQQRKNQYTPPSNWNLVWGKGDWIQLICTTGSSSIVEASLSIKGSR